MKFEIIITIVAAVAIRALAFFKRKDISKFLKKPEVLEFIKKNVLAAEKYIVGTNKGRERMNLVVDHLYNYLPEWAKKAVTREMLTDAVEYVFKQLAESIGGHTIAVDKDIN